MNFRRRLLEWLTSTIIFLLGIIMLISPESFDKPTLSMFYDYLQVWTPTLLIVGTLRIIALLINGHWHGGTPLLRLLGSLSGAAIFGAILGSLLQVSPWWTIPFGVVTYSVLTMGEMLNSFFTATDMANVRKYGR